MLLSLKYKWVCPQFLQLMFGHPRIESITISQDGRVIDGRTTVMTAN